MAIQRPEGTNYIDAGLSRRNASLPGILSNQFTAAVNPTNVTENNLFSYTMPAKVLNNNGKGVRIRAFATTAATAGTKRIRLYFGATVVVDTTATAFASAATAIMMIIDVLRVSKSVQVAVGLCQTAVVPTIGTTAPTTVSGLLVNSAPAENTSNAIVIKLTGQNGSAVASEATGLQFIVELLTEGMMSA